MSQKEIKPILTGITTSLIVSILLQAGITSVILLQAIILIVIFSKR